MQSAGLPRARDFTGPSVQAWAAFDVAAASEALLHPLPILLILLLGECGHFGMLLRIALEHTRS